MPKPTEAMREEARRGLDWRKEYGRGGTEVGVARARDIVNNRDLSMETIRRMNSYFARHEVDKQGEGFSQGEEGYPSAGRIAWARRLLLCMDTKLVRSAKATFWNAAQATPAQQITIWLLDIKGLNKKTPPRVLGGAAGSVDANIRGRKKDICLRSKQSLVWIR